jgi:tetratricopeptide (TPR) repeat protein
MSKRKKSFNNNKQARQTRSGISVPLKLNLSVLAGVTLIVLVAFLAYLPSINGGFVLDDNLFLAKNELIRASDGLRKLWCTTDPVDYWPVTYTTFWFEWRLWGSNPAGYHVSNLILHVIEALLIWLILRKLSIPGAFLAAMIFALHPVNVESAAWIASRKNLLAMLFFLLSILWYLKFTMSMAFAGITPARSYRGPREQEKTHSYFILHPSSFHFWYWLGLAAFLLAMLSKGSVAILPLLLLGIVWWLRPLTRWDVVRTAPFFLIALVMAVVNMWFQTHGVGEVFHTATITERLLGAGSVIWFYLYKALLPVDLAFVYPQWHIETGNPLWWLPLSAAIAVTAVLWLYRKGWGRPLLLSWFFFCVALLPVMGFADVGFMQFSLVADRYQHIAIIGVIALLSAGFSAWHQGMRGAIARTATALAIVAVGTLAFMTWRHSGIYRDAMTLYQDTLNKNPECWMAYNNLGLALSKTGRPQEEIKQYEQALRLKPDFGQAHNNLGAVLAEIGRPEEAIEHCEQALRLKPDYPEAHFNLGNALFQTGRLQEAIEHFQAALRLKPDFGEAHNNLGNALKLTGRYQEAIEHYEKALRLDPDYIEAHNNLGLALVQTGRIREGIEHYRQALRLKPDLPEAHYNLGNSFGTLSQYQHAIEHYEEALRLKPDYAEAHNNLGLALVDVGRLQDAIEHYEQALRLKPDYAEAHNNLGLALVNAGRLQEAIEHYQQALRLKPGYA